MTIRLFLQVLCLADVCVTLSLGLWPFHAPPNQVSWLQDLNGVEFGKSGTIFSRRPLAMRWDGQTGGSIEIWAHPTRWNTDATLLTLYNSQRGVLFSLRHSLTDLEVHSDSREERRDQYFEAEDAFSPPLRQSKPVLVTVTTSEQESKAYVNGRLAKTESRFPMPRDAFAGRIILGDAPRQPDSFRGRMRGLAIYGRELNAAEVARHYALWMQTGDPDGPASLAKEEGIIALYLFDEHSGRIVHSRSSSGPELEIPEAYSVVDKAALQPFWEEFNFSWSYWKGNFKNIIGFLPTGCCFCAYFMLVRPLKKAVPAAVLVGFAISLTIEVLQVFLPTRDSGTSDLVTNIFGTWLGALSFQAALPTLAERIPWLRLEPRRAAGYSKDA